MRLRVCVCVCVCMCVCAQMGKASAERVFFWLRVSVPLLTIAAFCPRGVHSLAVVGWLCHVPMGLPCTVTLSHCIGATAAHRARSNIDPHYFASAFAPLGWRSWPMAGAAMQRSCGVNDGGLLATIDSGRRREFDSLCTRSPLF